MSNKFCSKFCQSDGDCPNSAVCGSGGYCVKQQTTSDDCFAHSNCDMAEFCKQPAEGQGGACVPSCNPYSDEGCDEWFRCKWHYIAWSDEVKGECVESNSGGEVGDTCSPTNDPCQPDLSCVNVGGEGPKCFIDCNATTDMGCAKTESCLSLNASADPHHGVCVCSDPSCMGGETPDEDVTVQPVEDVVETPGIDIPEGSTPTGEDTATPGGNGDTQTPGGGGGSSGGGCATTGSGPAAPLWLLLLVGCLSLARRRTV